MRTTAIVPVKRFGAAKGRLAGTLPPKARKELCRAMLGDVLEAVGESSEVERILIVTKEWDLPVVDVPWTGVPDLRRSTHSKAAARGVERAIAEGAECVALLPGDCPLLDPAELDGALQPSAARARRDRSPTGTAAAPTVSSSARPTRSSQRSGREAASATRSSPADSGIRSPSSASTRSPSTSTPTRT